LTLLLLRGIFSQMRLGAKQMLSWVAIYAVALHTLLTGIGPAFAAAQDGVDPFSVICLHDTGAGTPDGQQPSDLVPGHACEHCNLCSAATPPPAPDLVVFGNLMPARLLQVLRPVSTAPSSGVAFRPNLARGPPLFV
jgi:hypothetical protein